MGAARALRIDSLVDPPFILRIRRKESESSPAFFHLDLTLPRHIQANPTTDQPRGKVRGETILASSNTDASGEPEGARLDVTLGRSNETNAKVLKTAISIRTEMAIVERDKPTSK
ncbi:MAG: hypothetical protein LYZ69_02305 [Nitrososphaerales archaeon]|nr:hypothetical protein [Nitrososphaerales archaeon]